MSMDKKVRNQKSSQYLDVLKNDKNFYQFVQRLKYWRKEKSYTQMQLSYECGFSKNKIQEVESLFTTITVNDIYKIADVLKLPVGVFFIDDKTIIDQLIFEYSIIKNN